MSRLIEVLRDAIRHRVASKGINKMLYKVHHDDQQGYWIGKVVKDGDGRALFVQQVGNYYQYKKVAERVANRLNGAA